MELDITDFFVTDAPRRYAASRHELGERAGEITWNNALEAASDYAFVTRETRSAIVAHVRRFGAWSIEEIAGWTDAELSALMIQFIAGDMCESELYALDDDGEWNWDAYYEAAQAGQAPSRMFKGDDDRIYYDLSE